MQTIFSRPLFHASSGLVLGTLLIYVLFMVEEFRKAPVENMDEVIYCVNGTYRLLEFLVAVCVVAYGVSETLFGEWTVMGSTIILVHSYYNVWLRAQLGWQSFLLRRDAVHKIQSMPTASTLQLQQHNDICSICFQDMKSAVITPCSHFFHATCLKKWLYVQETCPLCHGQLKSQLQPTSSPAAVTQAAPPANQNPAEVEQEKSEPQVELDTEEDAQAENAPPMKTSAEPELEMDSPSGSSKAQPKECDVVAEGSTGPAGDLDDENDDDSGGSCSTSDVH